MKSVCSLIAVLVVSFGILPSCSSSESGDQPVSESRAQAESAWNEMSPNERAALCNDLAVLDSIAAISLIVDGNQRLGSGDLSRAEAEIAYRYWSTRC